MNNVVLTDEEEEAVSLAEAASTLLDSPAFIKAVEAIRHQCSERILTSPPEDSAGRERDYTLSRGLTAVTTELLAQVSIGETITANAANNTDKPEAQDRDDPGQHANDY